MRPTGVKPTVPFFAPARLSNDHLMKLNGKTDPLFLGNIVATLSELHFSLGNVLKAISE